MSQFTHVLCPIDFSDASELVLDHAVRLAQGFGARITVLHVYQLMSLIYPEDALVDPLGTDARLRADAQERLQQAISKHAASAVPVALVLREGIPYVEILNAIAALGADVVVMGTHGRTGLQRALMGSVTERVLRGASVPVLSVRAQGA